MLSPENPFANPSELPYGLPPFDRIAVEHFRPAIAAGIAEHQAEVDAIAANTEPATFDNTIVALERSAALVIRALAVFVNLAGSDATSEIQEIQAEVMPQWTAHEDAIHLNAQLFSRISKLYQQRESLNLDAESLRLLERTYDEFYRAGAGLSDVDQKRLREINEKLSKLTTQFQENLLNDTNDAAIIVDSAEELVGLSSDAIATAAEAAAGRGLTGKYLLKLNLPTGQPVVASLENRDLREKVYRASVSRGNHDNRYNNSDLVKEVVSLRAERAALLGYLHHADYVIADRTARTADAVAELLDQLAPVAVRNAQKEADELEQLLREDHPDATLEPWDWSFYAERIRRTRYDVDDALLRPYFELNRVIKDGVFFAAEKLYGLTFVERLDLPKYHPDVRIFEVLDADGTGIGLFLGDYYTRDTKRGGAWMNSFVEQSRLLNSKPVVVNNLNIAHPPAGEPTLLTYDEVLTAFHEFGHALHGLLSSVNYLKFSGTNVAQDFVEFPSQVNEMWMLWPEVLANYAKHHETGEPLPQHLINKLIEAEQYGHGFSTTEYLAATLLDQAWHRITVDDIAGTDLTAETFEARALDKAGVAVAAVPPRYRSTYFAHIFSYAYSAGYYSYIWSEVFDADTVEWFKENGGLTRENGDRFRRELLAKGNSIDPVAAFTAFRGAAARLEPLLQRRGLTRT